MLLPLYSIYISYKVSVDLAKQFQRRRFSQIDQSETSLWRPCLSTDQNEMTFVFVLFVFVGAHVVCVLFVFVGARDVQTQQLHRLCSG